VERKPDRRVDQCHNRRVRRGGQAGGGKVPGRRRGHRRQGADDGDGRALLACVACFSLGALLVAPSQQTVTAELANPAALGSYFGVAALALALGGGLGNLAGGALYGLGRQLGAPALPWLVSRRWG
jgi:hypothetical protein